MDKGFLLKLFLIRLDCAFFEALRVAIVRDELSLLLVKEFLDF